MANGNSRRARRRPRVARINVGIARDTDEQLAEAARSVGISKAQFLREGGIARMSGAVTRADLDALAVRVAAIERHLGLGP